jgi:drug/metabolite transporter (DMT)-like permease
MIEGGMLPLRDILSSAWFLPALFLGSLFISIFYITALTVKVSGVAITSIAGKLSLIIPTIAAYLLYNDSFTVNKIAGVVIAMLAIVLTVYKKEKDGIKTNAAFYIFPVLILIGNGLIDSLTNHFQRNYVDPADFNFFLVFVFGTAAFMGWVTLAYRAILHGETLKAKSIRFGILLGVPNYGSMYFLIQALDKGGLESSVFFPVNNMCIVLVSCICAWAVFKENISAINLAGIFLSIVAIFLIIIK